MRSSFNFFTDLTNSLQAINKMITNIFLMDLHCFQSKYHKVDNIIFLVEHNVLVSVAGPPAFQDISTLQSGMWLQPTEICIYLLQFT